MLRPMHQFDKQPERRYPFILKQLCLLANQTPNKLGRGQFAILSVTFYATSSLSIVPWRLDRKPPSLL